MHDATKVLLGSTGSSDRVVDTFASDPANFPAGKAVSLDSEGALSLDASDGQRVGVSLGKSLSDHKKTAVCRAGLRVPLLCMDRFARGTVTITSYANLIDDTDDTITIGETVFTAQAGAATPGDATFQAATSNDATATSLAAQINAHVTAGALVEATAVSDVVHIVALEAGDDGEDIVFEYDDVDGTGDSVGATVSGEGFLVGGGDDLDVVKGAAVYVDSVTGMATDEDSATAVVTNAVYAESGRFTGVAEDGSTLECAIIDMPGGL